ncbi:MAG: twin-arginine translocase TatA/TatE family subunit [Deltaproteobacteria bacterium]
MFGLGMQELIIILIIVLIIFGAGKLPDVGNALGKGIRNFKKASGGDDNSTAKEIPDDKNKPIDHQ